MNIVIQTCRSALIVFLLLQKEHLKNAQQYFHLVGGSASECDTIPGRQSMVYTLDN